MARPLSQGLTYFSLDVDMEQDDKIAYIESKHGPIAFAVIVRLLMKIYKNGYFTSWTEREQYLFTRSIGVDIESTETIVIECINEGFFNKALYNRYKVLTSAGIQRRYLTACARRKDVPIIRQYFLLSEDEQFKCEMRFVDINDDENEVNDDINQGKSDIMPTETPQSKVKESKVKESKVLILSKDNIGKSPTPEVVDSESVDYQKVIDLFHELCSRLPKVRMLTDARRKKIKPWFKKGGIESFEEVFQKLGMSDFCCGINDRGWQANLDWVLNPQNWAKVLEGKYDNKTPRGNGPNGGGIKNSLGKVPTSIQSMMDME